jgi:3-hydroxyisobutyrate dehydrogenase-like beta-hydroxyacid dehydrogenase
VSVVGFVGVGTMGGRMARRVLEGGHALVVTDVRREAAEPLEAAGATWAPTAAAVAEQAEGVVCLSLPGPAEVEAVVGQLLPAARPGTVVVDLSTNALTTVRRLHAEAAAAGVRFLDAPVSGGSPAAETGTLAVMVGGDAAAFEDVRPVLQCIGDKLTHLGESGAGTLVKLVNNAVFLCGSLLFQEGLVMATKAGMDPATLVGVLQGASSAPFTGMARGLLGRRFEPALFALSLAEKDIALALSSARDLGVPMPVAAAAHQTYLEALTAGHGGQQFFATLQEIERRAGVEVPVRELP